MKNDKIIFYLNDKLNLYNIPYVVRNFKVNAITLNQKIKLLIKKNMLVPNSQNFLGLFLKPDWGAF